MIIIRTPLRISFVGGGTDIASFYQLETGAVVSTTIDKYIWVFVNDKFDKSIRICYSNTENVIRIEDIKHDIIRNALLMSRMEFQRGLEIATLADVPGKGTGLGSSSSLAVSIMNALDVKNSTKWDSENERKKELARLACKCEIEMCCKPIGKQDQYAASFGGANLFRFQPDGKVDVKPIPNAKKTFLKILPNLMLFYIGKRKLSSDQILLKQSSDMSMQKIRIMRQMADMAEQMFLDLERGATSCIGDYLHNGWILKKQLAEGISNTEIDEIYERARANGAIGGKILGAGGGGFLLIYARPGTQQAIKKVLKLRQIEFDFEYEGTTIVHNDKRGIYDI